MSIYRVHFKWKGKDVVVCAKNLDLTHPYFVSIKDLLFPSTSSVIINPSDDDLKRAFGDTNHLMIPLGSVALVEELNEAERARVMPFSLVERAGGPDTAADPDAVPEGDTGESEAEPW
jgi:hypothetical protein